jgi:hypothetical protein
MSNAMIEFAIYFTSLGGYQAKIVGDEPALRAIEDSIRASGHSFQRKTRNLG